MFFFGSRMFVCRRRVRPIDVRSHGTPFALSLALFCGTLGCGGAPTPLPHPQQGPEATRTKASTQVHGPLYDDPGALVPGYGGTLVSLSPGLRDFVQASLMPGAKYPGEAVDWQRQAFIAGVAAM